MTAIPPPPPPYVPPPPRRPSRLPAFIGYWIAYAVMLILPAALFVSAMFIWVPQVRDVYKGFKLSLPALSEWVISMAGTVHTATFWVEVILSVGLVSIILAAITALMPRGFMRAAIAMFCMLLVLGWTVAEALLLYSAIWDPLLKVMRSVQGAP